ncbi:MAG: 5'/3'-nucleotidase SurE [Bacteroidales bacterium]|nr:5'/3'-nucleotidase SurE [Bacteroidales bacterium]
MKETVNRPYILITNDDGFEAKGIQKLTEALRSLGDIVVFAPDSPRSGASSAITITGVSFRKVSEEKGLTVYCCSGTPVDCIKLALNNVLEKKPDLIVSGINHGSNAAVSVVYSGTLGAAAEGAIFRIPSVGFSLDNHLPDADFSETQKIATIVCKKILEESLPNGTYLNVNVPAVEHVKGIKMCSQTEGKWENEFYEKEDAKGDKQYFFAGEFVSNESQLPSNDIAWLNKGYATIVPCKIDITDYSLLSKMTSWETSSLSLSEQ